jgi:hypothetical protein
MLQSSELQFDNQPKENKMTSKLRTIIITAAIALPLGAFAGGALKGHPNLTAADKAINTAWDKVVAAQNANEFDMDGHAQKAKDALETAVKEIKIAAEVATDKKDIKNDEKDLAKDKKDLKKDAKK